MKENSPKNVFAAFEMLLEEIEVEIDFINKAGANAFQRSDYDSVEQHRERARQATVFMFSAFQNYLYPVSFLCHCVNL